MLKIISIIACWISIVSAGAYLRVEQLSERPFHADEATGARLTATRMESGDYRFDPVHFHGPLLSSLAVPLCKLRGETCWNDLTKFTLRLIPATAGTLLLLVPLAWRRQFGDGSMLLAAALLASSPLLVYYSRMFIHESLLVLLGGLVLVGLLRWPRYGIPGLLIGLMFATKESFVISILAWTSAAILVLWENRESLTRPGCINAWNTYRLPLALSVLAAVVVAGFFYTNGFRQLERGVDAVRTFFVYQTVEGHDKPFNYYTHLLTIPSKAGGTWWFGTPLVILALFAFASNFRCRTASSNMVRFLAYSAAGHFVIYSAIAYKTPWLACLPWAHVCLLAGIGVSGFLRHSLPVKVALSLLVGTAIVTQLLQTRRATGRLASDERNPFAYVPTRRDVESLEPFLKKLQDLFPADSLEPIAVVGSDYWPLPWYLRSFKQIGYWSEPPDDLDAHALIFSMPEATTAAMLRLQQTHVALPRGLRAGVPIHLFVRNDVWNLWMKECE